MKKVLASLLIGCMVLGVGCGGIKEGAIHKDGYLNVNTDMEHYGEQFHEGVKVMGKGVLGTLDNIGCGVKYVTHFRKETMEEHFLEFNYDEVSNIYEKYDLRLGDYIYFEGVLNENEEIEIEYIKVIDSPTED